MRKHHLLNCALELKKIVEEIKFETRCWYTPLIQNLKNIPAYEMPCETTVANDLEKTLIGLPFSLNLQEKDIDRVIETIDDAL